MTTQRKVLGTVQQVSRRYTFATFYTAIIVTLILLVLLVDLFKGVE